MLIALADLLTDLLVELKELLTDDITKQFCISCMFAELC